VSEEALRPAPRRWLAAAVALHFVLGGIYVAVLPLWGGAPDEPIHYSRIKYEGEFGKFALITNPRLWGEPLAVYCFTADPVGAAAHGPLYYATGVPIFRLTRGLTVQQQLYALRCLSLLYGAAMIPLAWWILGMLFPKDPGLVVAGTYVVLLHPHRLLMSAVVYNDIATGATMFLFLGLLLRAARDEGPAKAWFWAGCAFGLAFLAKRVALVAIPGTVVALLLQQRRVGLSRAEAAQRLALWAVGGFLVCGWWVLRDYRLYGVLFPTEPGFGNASWLEAWFRWGDQFWWGVRYCLRGLWLSIWSQVGWVPWHDAPAWIVWQGKLLYGLFGLGSGLAVVGYLGGYRSRWRGLSAEQRDALTVFVVVILGMIYGAVHWVMRFSFHNNEETGKHAIALFVCLVTLLAATWRWLLGPRRAPWGLWVGVALMAWFNGAALTWLRVELIPRWAPPTPALAGERVKDLPSGVAPGMWHRYRVPGTVQRGGYVEPPSPPEQPLQHR